ncbi:hypothetical protein OH77DRAFT_813217 [Trametes cingulata]|nr:hypothetical protein OH77DRAFT_813217 [Trametes cingulata]
MRNAVTCADDHVLDASRGIDLAAEPLFVPLVLGFLAIACLFESIWLCMRGPTKRIRMSSHPLLTSYHNIQPRRCTPASHGQHVCAAVEMRRYSSHGNRPQPRTLPVPMIDILVDSV